MLSKSNEKRDEDSSVESGWLQPLFGLVELREDVQEAGDAKSISEKEGRLTE